MCLELHKWVKKKKITFYTKIYPKHRHLNKEWIRIVQSRELLWSRVCERQLNWLWSLLPKNRLALIRSSSYLHTAHNRSKTVTRTVRGQNIGVMKSARGTKWFLFSHSLLSDFKCFRAWVRNEEAFMLKTGLIKKRKDKDMKTPPAMNAWNSIFCDLTEWIG